MAMLTSYSRDEAELTLGRKLLDIRWGLVVLLCAIASVGFAMLYSAAGGNLDPWASRQMVRFAGGLVLLVLVALVDIRVWLRWAYAFYALGIVLLLAVTLFGRVGMGAQRWLDLGLFQVQPSEIMKISLILALARYFHRLADEDVRKLHWLLPPAALIAAPMVLVLKQPDLGTALMLGFEGAAVCFLAGVALRYFIVAGIGAAAMLPIAWEMMHEYQRKRVLIFLNPESDPLGSGYHILQSKIALGSGGLFGKGFLEGSQAHLNFLPEKQTDFIFTALAEELGLVGGLALIGLYLLVVVYGYAISLRSGSQFGRLIGLGITSMLFIYVFINVAMVSGLVPVVGVPLPLVSYGGTAMLTLLIGFGLVLGVYVHRDVEMPRRGTS
jgi:rod shape determining protein RodA